LLDITNQFDEDTVFIVSDCDEIINKENINFLADWVQKYKQLLIKVPLIHLEGKANLRVYNKDTNEPKQWDKSMFLCTKEHLSKATPTQMRSAVNLPFNITYITQNDKPIQDLGWHFSWMGDSLKRKIKRESFIHYNDKLSYLGNTTYEDKDVVSIVESKDLKVGDTPPSGDRDSVLQLYDTKNLPDTIHTNNNLKKYFLN
jgi:hypothetical protein